MKRKTRRSAQASTYRGKKKLYLFIAFLVAAVGYGIYYFIPQDENRQITTQPAHAASIASEKRISSSFTLDIPAHSPDPADGNEKLKLQAFNGLASGPRECSNLRGIRNSCYATKYHYSITSGPANISSGTDGTINISVPVFISGKGSQQGRAKDRSQSEIRYFQSKLMANANVSASVDSNWCPRLHIKPNFTWTEPTRVEVFHKSKTDIQYLVEKLLHDPLVALGDTVVKNFIGCDKIQGTLSKVWQSNSLPISKADKSSEQYINVQPKSLGYTGLKLVSDQLYMGFTIKADTTISDQPEKPEPRKLPKPIELSSGSGSALVAVPIDIKYEQVLHSVQSQIGNEPFSTRNRWGSFIIRVKAIKIYPSNNELVLGLKLHMENSNSWKDTYGWVFMTISPEVTEASNGIALKRPVFTKPVDLKEWVTIKRALDESIVRKIKKEGLLVKFSEETRHLIDNLKHDMEKSHPGYPVRFMNASFMNNDVSLLAGGIRVNGSLSAKGSFTADTDTEYEYVGTEETLPVQAARDESHDEIQLKIDNLLKQMNAIEQNLDQFRKILKK